jgi:G protein-coupled receptor 158
MYQYNSTHHTEAYEDGAWTKPYYDCGGGNIW